MSDEQMPRCGGTGMTAYWDGSAYAGEMCRGCVDCEGPDEQEPTTTGGSQAPEAGEDRVMRALGAERNIRGELFTEYDLKYAGQDWGGGSDTARLQQIRKRVKEIRNERVTCERCERLTFELNQRLTDDEVDALQEECRIAKARLEVQALAIVALERDLEKWTDIALKEEDRRGVAEDALRTVQQERDRITEQLCGDVRAVSEDYTDARAEIASLRADVERLTAESDIRGITLEKERTELVAAEQQNHALRTSITHLHAWNSGDMQIRHRQVVLADDLATLLAIKS